MPCKFSSYEILWSRVYVSIAKPTDRQGGCPYPFRGQRVIGTVWLGLDFFLFLVNVAGICTRARFHPAAFKHDVHSPEHGIWLPCIPLAFATLFVG